LGRLGVTDRPRAGQFLISRQRDLGAVNARLEKEWLVPGDERRRLPAGLVVDRERGQPVRQEDDVFPIAPPALFVRERQRVIECDRDRFALRDRRRQGDDERGVDLLLVVGGERRGVSPPWLPVLGGPTTSG